MKTLKNLQVRTVNATIMMVVVLIMSVFTSCSDNIDEALVPESLQQTKQELPDYAVLFYGHGGMMMSLDVDICRNIYDCYTADPSSYDNVKVAVQYKWSPSYNLLYSFMIGHLTTDTLMTSKEEKAFVKTHAQRATRFILDPAQKGRDYAPKEFCYGPKQLLESPLYGEEGFDSSHPDSLRNFINWAVKACPAKRYVLVISSHGAGYCPDIDDEFRFKGNNIPNVPTKGVMPDANTEKQMSVPELKAALQSADKRMDAVFFDACLMNMMEVVYELHDVTDYVVASTFPVPAKGGDFKTLINELGKGYHLERALGNFCRANGESWTNLYKGWNAPRENFDQSVIRTSGLPEYAAKVKDFTNRLVDAYKNGGDDVKRKIDVCTATAIKIENMDPYYEFHSYLETLQMAVPQYFPQGCYESLNEAFKNCLVERVTSPRLKNEGFEMGVSVLLAHEGTYELYGWKRSDNGEWRINKRISKSPDFLDTYEQLAWDRATGWSRWLLLNRQEPNQFSLLDATLQKDDVVKFDLPKEK